MNKFRSYNRENHVVKALRFISQGELRERSLIDQYQRGTALNMIFHIFTAQLGTYQYTD
jgi:hypothetical protein